MEELDLVKRIEGHLARGNELLERIDGRLDRLDEELRLSRLSREQSDASSERLFAAFNRLVNDVAERFDRAERRTERALESFERRVEGFGRKLDESIAGSVSHREALFRILERLGPDGSSAAA